MDFQKDLGRWTDQLDQPGRDVLQKARNFTMHEQAEQFGLYPYFQPIDENQGPVARYKGNEVLMLGSNNYLGLTTHPKVREAAQDAIKKFGTAMTGSRFLNGTLKLHEELEAKIASFIGKEAALVFTTGYQANLGMLSALINRHSVVVVDKSAHASIHDGCRLMEGENLKFKHNDLSDLRAVLDSVPADKGPLICVDGVYSMEGDLAPLKGIVQIVKENNVRLAVDDAHGLGVMGPGGRGTCHHFNVKDDVDLIVGTFSKSLASTGGFVAGEKRVIAYIKHFGRPMIFSASLTPSCAAAASAALDVLIEEPERAEKVRENTAIMNKGLTEIGYETGEIGAAIVPIVIRDDIKTLMVWKELLDEGIYTNPVFYPAVAKGRAMLRTSYLATHTQKHLERALEVFQKVAKTYQIAA